MNTFTSFFTKTLLQWNAKENQRQMPWKGEKDPYKIWISEIILQQTRVEQGLEYYNRFIKTFSTVKKLALANEKEVFKLWEGLGYYSRCRNLIATAKYIAGDLKAVFPTKYEDILQLKGIGSYTAAAISSFAYNLPHAVVDGNVSRVLARFFGIEMPIDSTTGKNYFFNLANELLDKKNASIYNQAIMDFGATVCKPKAALCTICPLQKKCVAYSSTKVDILPKKEKKIIVKNRWLNYVLVFCNDEVLVRERTKKEIWQNLHEFVLIEKENSTFVEGLLLKKSLNKILQNSSYTIQEISKEYSQLLSHQLIKGKFIVISINKKPKIESYNWVHKKDLKKIAFPKFINAFLQDKKYL
jgi:A/G-specific adenine glycosylase